LAGLRLRQTHSRVAAPPICSSTVELDSPFGAEDMCLVEITIAAPKNKNRNRLPSFALSFLYPVRWCAVRVQCMRVVHVRFCSSIPMLLPSQVMSILSSPSVFSSSIHFPTTAKGLAFSRHQLTAMLPKCSTTNQLYRGQVLEYYYSLFLSRNTRKQSHAEVST
jgi:hypothetical protein